MKNAFIFSLKISVRFSRENFFLNSSCFFLCSKKKRFARRTPLHCSDLYFNQSDNISLFVLSLSLSDGRQNQLLNFHFDVITNDFFPLINVRLSRSRPRFFDRHVCISFQLNNIKHSRIYCQKEILHMILQIYFYLFFCFSR